MRREQPGRRGRQELPRPCRRSRPTGSATAWAFDSFYSTRTGFVSCPYPDLLTGGGFDTDNVDIKASGPNGNNGWYVRADGGLEGGSVTVYAQCLHVQTG